MIVSIYKKDSADLCDCPNEDILLNTAYNFMAFNGMLETASISRLMHLFICDVKYLNEYTYKSI